MAEFIVGSVQSKSLKNALLMLHEWDVSPRNFPVTDSQDGAFIRLDTTNGAETVLHLKNGTRIHFPGQSGPASKMVDSNGNVISFQQLPDGSVKITDTVGRVVNLTISSGQITSVQYKNSTGVDKTITLAYTYDAGNHAPNPPFSEPHNYLQDDPVYPQVVVEAWPNFSGYMLTSITLPDQLGVYQFGYNVYAELERVQYSTGGETKYGYTGLPFAVTGENLPMYYYCQAGSGFSGKSDARQVLRRAVTTTPGSGYQVTQYTPTANISADRSSRCGSSPINNEAEDVADALGNRTHYEFASGPLPTVPAAGQEAKRQVFEGTSTLKHTVQSEYIALSNSYHATYPLPWRITTTLDNGQQSKVEYTYDTHTSNVIDNLGAQRAVSAYINNPVLEVDYDYGLATVLRKISTAWLKTNPVNSINYFDGTDAGRYIHVWDRKLNEQIKDANNNTLSSIRYEYDQYAYTGFSTGRVATSAAQHESRTYSGDLTKVERWRNTDGVWLPTLNQYDDAGNILKTRDPGLHDTTFDFTDNWANTTCQPAQQSKAYVKIITNALGQQITHKYNSCTGTRDSTVDANAQTTSLTYDGVDRVDITSFPDGGQTDLDYDDLNRVITTKKKQDTSGHYVASRIQYDTLGRVSRDELCEDGPTCATTIKTDTTYDVVGQKSCVTNPYRTGSETTAGNTCYGYDALGRVTQVAPPDGTQPPSYGGACQPRNVCTSYSGNTTTVTDEAGKKRKIQSDALRRLAFVWEDPTPGVNYETDYTYDVMGNLLSVTQKGDSPSNSVNWRTRSFAYNSLSLLTSAVNNPESGTMQYSYNDDAVLVGKTDARGITINYNPSDGPIDAIHRVTKKTYSNGDPSVTYSYDAFVSGTNFGKGHRTGMTDASGSSSWTYDTLGRQWSETHTITGASGSKTISTMYNLDGSVNTVTYPTGSGSVLAYTYNLAGRVTMAKDTAHNITYFQNATYYPGGQLNQAKYGSVMETAIFNARQQPCWFYATTGTPLSVSTLCTGTASTANVLDLKYGFGLGANDNGNVQSLTNNKDSNRSVTYGYDALNRVASATTPNTDCSLVPGTSLSKNWGETFTIDPWGNLTQRTVTKCSAEPLSASTLTGSNRLSGFGYDSAGNMTSNGSATFTYSGEGQLATAGGATYTYDGDGSRVKKSTGTLYWGAGPLLESDLSGNLQREFIFVGGKRIARRDISGGAQYYFFTDHLGSSDVVTTSVGAVQNESDYYPYGGERAYSQTLANQSYKFTGRERDSESGLDNFGARFNASSLGRFVCPDPIVKSRQRMVDPQQWNMYSYVRNTPIVATDPSGAEVRFGNKADAEKALAEYRAQLPENQRSAVSYKPQDEGFKLTVDAKAAQKAGEGSKLGQLKAVADSKRVAEVKYVSGDKAIVYLKNTNTDSPRTATSTLNQQGLGGVTLFEKGTTPESAANNLGINSVKSGVTEIYLNPLSPQNLLNTGAPLMHETLEHFLPFTKTGDAEKSAHPPQGTNRQEQ